MPKDRRKEARYYTYLGKQHKSTYLSAFGLELLSRRSPVLFVVEGVFDASPLHLLGANALATLGNNPNHLSGWLRSQGFHLVGLTDGDSAGKKLARHVHETVSCEPGKDPASMGLDWCRDLVRHYGGGTHT